MNPKHQSSCHSSLPLTTPPLSTRGDRVDLCRRGVREAVRRARSSRPGQASTPDPRSPPSCSWCPPRRLHCTGTPMLHSLNGDLAEAPPQKKHSPVPLSWCGMRDLKGRRAEGGNKNKTRDRSAMLGRTKGMMAISSQGLEVISRLMIINKSPRE